MFVPEQYICCAMNQSRSSHLGIFWMITKWNFSQIWIMIVKTFMKWVTGCKTYMRTCVPEAGTKGRVKKLHPTLTVGCNYLSLPSIPASSIQVLIWHHAIYQFSICLHSSWNGNLIYLGWGLLSQFLPFRYFLNFSSLSKHTLAVKYRVYIWQVSPQLSCGDTCQIWMWFEESNMYFCKIEYFAYGEINERSFSNPHPRLIQGMRLHCFIWCYKETYIDYCFELWMI